MKPNNIVLSIRFIVLVMNLKFFISVKSLVPYKKYLSIIN